MQGSRSVKTRRSGKASEFGVRGVLSKKHAGFRGRGGLVRRRDFLWTMSLHPCSRSATLNEAMYRVVQYLLLLKSRARASRRPDKVMPL